MDNPPPEWDRSDEAVRPSGTPPTDDAAALPPLWTRAARVFVSPGGLFRTLRARPAILGALVLGAALVALGNAAIPLEVYEEGLAAQMTELGRDVPGDPAVMARVMKVGGIFGAFLVWPLVGVVAAGIYALLFLFGLGYRGSYRQYLSVTAHALLVPAAGALVVVPFKIATADPTFALTLGNFFFFLGEGFAARLLGLLDLFNLWAYALVGIGASALDGSRSVRASVSAAVGIALVFSILVAALGGLAG
jgi:hypothetical protein